MRNGFAVKEYFLLEFSFTGHTQNNGAFLIVNTIKTAPFFCVFPVYQAVLAFQAILNLSVSFPYIE
jgi:hypothetical protein